MNFENHILLLQRIHQLIRLKATGTPQVLSSKLSLSLRQTHRIISHLKCIGFPIAYCNYNQSYYYTQEVSCNIEVKVGNTKIL